MKTISQISFRHCAVVTFFAACLAPASAFAQTQRDFTQPLPAEKRASHALNRLAFGARPGEVASVNKMGVQRWIEWQLSPEKIDDSQVDQKLSDLPTLRYDSQTLMLAELADGPLMKKAREAAQQKKKLDKGQEIQGKKVSLSKKQRQALEMVKEANLPQRASLQAIGELQLDKITRAIDSKRQLNEVMVDFWSNHFNIDVKKKGAGILKIADERDVIRPHIWGKFRDLLGASAKSPAMLIYLDNAKSTKVMEVPPRRNNPKKENQQPIAAAQPDAKPVVQTRGGLNENYGREIMELHTLGVEGGYTQKDVQEVARCFTGWTVDRNTGSFIFRPYTHDDGEKEVLGHRIPAGGGINDGEQVLDILASSPATAKHLAHELCVRLVADQPPQSIVDKAANTYMQTDGDLRAVVKTIVTSPEFFSVGAYRSKIKSPFEYAVSSVRALGGTILVSDDDQQARVRLVSDGVSSAKANAKSNRNGSKTMAVSIADMGQPLYSFQAPTGYSENSQEWVSAGALVARLNFALAMVDGNVYNVISTPTILLNGIDVRDSKTMIARLTDQLLGGDVAPRTLSTLTREAGAEAIPNGKKLTALILGSPEFQRH